MGIIDAEVRCGDHEDRGRGGDRAIDTRVNEEVEWWGWSRLAS